MKIIIPLVVISLLFHACNWNDIKPKKLQNKWQPTYLIQNKDAEGNWGPWVTLDSVEIGVPLPVIEFTADGRFLRDGKNGAECCRAGNKYRVSGNKIIFSDTKSCPLVYCVECERWIIEKLETDTLELEQCYTKFKYFRQK